MTRVGTREQAIEWATRALDTEREEPAVLYNVACVFAQLDEKDKAIDALEKAVSMGFGYRAWIENDTDLNNLREQERFKTLLQGLN